MAIPAAKQPPAPTAPKTPDTGAGGVKTEGKAAAGSEKKGPEAAPAQKTPGIGKAGKTAEVLAADVTGRYVSKKELPSKLRDQLKAEGGPGSAPDPSLRERLAGPLGWDPQSARFHTGPVAASAARELQASAFTIGQDVFFGANKFDPTTPKGIGLIAHEATHVQQQTGAKGDKTRFFSQKGGDEMEQEAQEAAQLVLSDLGRGEYLHVREYVRNYSTEAGEPITQADRNRLDAISLKALKVAQKEFRHLKLGRIKPPPELSIDIDLDLGEKQEEDLVQQWADAIVAAVMALRSPAAAVQPAVQREPTPTPPAATATSMQVGIDSLAPYIMSTTITMSADAAALKSTIMGLSTFEVGGKGTIRIFSAIIKDAGKLKEFDKSKAYDETDHLHFRMILQPSPSRPGDVAQRGDIDSFNKMIPAFNTAALAAKAEADKFLADFLEQGKTAFLALTDVSRKQVGAKLEEYGFATNASLIKDPANYKFAGGNNISSKMKDEAQKLLPLIKKVEQDKEAAENLKSWLHMHVTGTNAQIKAEEIMAKDLPQATADWNRALAEASAKYPIMSQFDTFDKMEELANSGNPQELILKQLVTILVNLDTLDDKAKSDPGKIVFDMPKARQEAEKKFTAPWQIGLAEMTAEDRGDAAAGWMTLLGAIAAALSLGTGGGAGVAFLALKGAGVALSAGLLLQEIQDYRLADAAHMSDMDVAKALSSEDPSLFWLAFDIVTTLVGIRGELVEMKAAFNDIQIAYKLAKAEGETAGLEKILNNHHVPPDTVKVILAQAMHGAIALTNFIRNPDEMTVLGVLGTFNSFMEFRTAMFSSKEPPESITTAKKVVQKKRVAEVQTAADTIKAKHPAVTIKVIDQGFDHPVIVAVTSSEGHPPGGPPPAAGGPGSGKGGTKIGSPAPDPNAHPGGTQKGFPAPDPNAHPGGTLKGPPASAAKPLPPGVTPGSGKIPDGVYAVKDAAHAIDPALDKTAKPSDPALAKTAKPSDPALAKTAKPDPPPANPPSADPALAKTGPAVPPSQLKQAIEELNLANVGGTPLVQARDLNVLDPNASAHTYEGIELDPVTNEWVSTKTKAPIGRIPEEDEGATTNQYTYASLGKAKAQLRGQPDYQASWIGLPPGRYVVVPDHPIMKGGTSIKFVLQDTVTKAFYIFKPAAGEMPLTDWGHQAHYGTLFVRGAFASHLAEEMPAMGEQLPHVTVVVHDGRVGSLQPLLEGTRSLESLMESKLPEDKALYDRVMNDDPGFRKFREGLRAFDHVINNTDRDTNPGNMMIHEDPVTKKISYFAIDSDASLGPGARAIIDPRATVLPRSNLSESWTDPAKPTIGKISKALYQQMVGMIANESTVKNQWKKAFGLNDAALDGVMGRMREVVRDFADRRTKAPDSEVFFD